MLHFRMGADRDQPDSRGVTASDAAAQKRSRLQATPQRAVLLDSTERTEDGGAEASERNSLTSHNAKLYTWPAP